MLPVSGLQGVRAGVCNADRSLQQCAVMRNRARACEQPGLIYRTWVMIRQIGCQNLHAASVRNHSQDEHNRKYACSAASVLENV